METSNLNENTSMSHVEFHLFGFPGILLHRPFLIIPFLSIYLGILMGNCVLMHRIWVEKTLQSPMYWLISLLFSVNVLCTTAIVPKFLLGLAFGLNQISLSSCLVQMFFVYLAIIFESSLMLLMALDRYVAIFRPLHYHSIMTHGFLVKLISVCVTRGVLLASPIIILISRVQFCRSNVILSFACENMAVLKLGCGNISVINLTGLLVRIFISTMDGGILLVSYVVILHKAMGIVKGNAFHKTLHTCCTHMIVSVVIYSCGLLSSIVYRIDASISINLQNLVSTFYYLFPAGLNPIVYGVRIREIRVCLIKAYSVRT